MEKEFENGSGIYALVCNENGFVYIGQTNDFYRRLGEHMNDLCRGDHHNRMIQDDYNKYGAESFEFVILERCEEQSCRDDAEQKYISQYRDIGKCYNQFSGGITGYYAYDEFKEYCSKVQTGRHFSESCKEKHSDIAKRQWAENNTYRDMMVASAKRQWQNPEYRQKMLDAHLGKHPAKKLNEDKVREIKELRKNGQSCASIAKLYSIAPCTVQQIVTNKIWKGVE